MGEVITSFYSAILRAVGAPASVQNLQACNAWQDAEGGKARNNPWNTTQPMPGATDYNSAHVKNYPTATVGIEATARTLQNGRYPYILHWLREGSNGLAVCRAVDASPWGTHSAAAVYARLYPHTDRRNLRLTIPYMKGADVVIVQHRLQAKGFNVGASQADGIYGPDTVKAVRRFQNANHLPIDGIVGPLTYRRLGI
jgi:hypothetical protein